ncbi:MAG: NUDIX domain-containing protein [Candidatus Thorarchaeota archaeon]
MTSMIPIVISILRCNEKYLFLKRANPPYENLWSLVGGKMKIGEHILDAARREIFEETGASDVYRYEYRGIVSERLVQSNGLLSSHFLIFIGHGEIDSFRKSHREGELAVFSLNEINLRRSEFLPSDLFMFDCFREASVRSNLYEAELEHDNGKYTLKYYREAT